VYDDGYGDSINDDSSKKADGAISGIENLGGTEAYNDTLIGNDDTNKIYGYGGDDSLYGKGGADVLYGDSGLDNIYGGDGDDTLYGGGDDDTLRGGDGVDEYHGDNGSDDYIAFDDVDSEGHGINISLAKYKNTVENSKYDGVNIVIDDGYGNSETVVDGISNIIIHR